MQEMRRKHSSIVDALSGRRLNVSDQVVAIKIENEHSSSGSDTEHAFLQINDVHGLSTWLFKAYETRMKGDFSKPACVLLTGEPASGKTCLMSQLISLVLKDSESGTALIPVLIKIADLQRYLLQEIQDAKSTDQAFSTSWNWADVSRQDSNTQPYCVVPMFCCSRVPLF